MSIQELIATKAFQKWQNENKGFIEDLNDLLSEMMMFEAKYGVSIKPSIQKYEGKQSRNFGVETKQFVNIINEENPHDTTN